MAETVQRALKWKAGLSRVEGVELGRCAEDSDDSSALGDKSAGTCTAWN